MDGLHAELGRAVDGISGLDTERVVNDCKELFAATPALKPNRAEDEYGRPVVELRGTVPFSFSGRTYHAPVRIVVDHTYPNTPPLCYVVPNQGMVVAPNNPDVDPATGECNIQILKEWNASQSNLLLLYSALAHSFSLCTPVYKPSSSKQTSGPRSRVGETPQPPSPRDASPSPPQSNGRNSNPAAPGNNAGGGGGGGLHVRNNSGGSSGGTLRRGSGDAALQLSPGEQLAERLRRKALERLAMLSDEVSVATATRKALLERANQLEASYSAYERERDLLRANVHALEAQGGALETWLQECNRRKASEHEQHVDRDVAPDSPLSAQLLDLVATDKAIGDMAYFLNKALELDTLPIEEWLKTTRLIHKEQYHTRALIRKIVAARLMSLPEER